MNMRIIGKKGIEEIGVVAKIALLLVVAALILVAFQNFSAEADDAFQQQVCKTSNEIRFGLKSASGNVLASPQICNTIDKRAKGDQVPTKKYLQNTEGASREMRDMIEQCWDMWLDGAQFNTFEQFPFSDKGCFTCFTFKMKEGSDPVKYEDVVQKLEEPFKAIDTSDKCTPNGGYWRDTCKKNEIKTGKTKYGSGEECCVVQNSECETRGGECSREVIRGKEVFIGDQAWNCRDRKASCYVDPDNTYSYIKYIREAGPRSGDVVFLPSKPGDESVTYVEKETYAISFVSPSQQLCPQDSVECYAKIGGYALVGGTLVWVGAPLAGVATTVLTFLGATGVATIGSGVAIDQYALGGRLTNQLANGLISATGITEEVPNFIMVSTAEQAQQASCVVQFGGVSNEE